MSDSKEIDVVDVDNNITTKLKWLPHLKKWLEIEYEELRVQALEVVEGTGAPHEHHEVKNVLTNRWVKMHDSLHDSVAGA